MMRQGASAGESNQLLAAALRYASQGLAVFPVHSATGGQCTCGNSDCDRVAKHPRTMNGLKDATTDERTIRAWWRRWPEANIGIVTGAISNLVVIDNDPRHGGDQTLAKLEERHGTLPETVTSRTGGADGGCHKMFVHPGVHIKNRTGGKGGWPQGLDVRGDGGYVVVAPSLHISGRHYSWAPGKSPGEIPFAPLPNWLLDRLTADEQIPANSMQPAANGSPRGDDHERLMQAATHYLAAVPGRPKGCRDDCAFSLAGHLVSFVTEDTGLRLTEPEIVALVRTWDLRNAEPLGEVEIAKKVRSAFKGNGTPRPDHVVRRREPPDDGGFGRLSRLCRITHGNKNSQNEDDPWPDPPNEAALRGLAGDAVRLIEPHSEADPVAILGQFLVCFGNAIGRSAHFLAEADRHYTNLDMCLVGATAKGRKGTSAGRVLRMFESVDPTWKNERVQCGLSSGEGLIWAVRDPTFKREPIRQGRGKNAEVVGYQDVEVDAGVSDKRLLALESEFASVLKVMSRERNTLSAIIRQAWDTGNLRTLTKNSPAVATGAHISIVGHITRDELRREITETDMANGFANRFLWFCVKRSKCLPDGGHLHDEDFGPLIRRLSDAVDFAANVDRMVRDVDAGEIWHAVYPSLSDGRPGLLGAVTSRAEAQVMRLAMIYALLDSSSVIRGDHLESALALWDYCEASASYIFGSALGDPTADAILKALHASPEGLSRTAIRDLFGKHKSAADIDRALILLREHSLVLDPIKEKTDGRPVEVWRAKNTATEAT